MTHYKWATPYEWLEQAVREGRVATHELLSLIQSVDPDKIQDNFESSMARDGYFDLYEDRSCSVCGHSIKSAVSVVCSICRQVVHKDCTNKEDSEADIVCDYCQDDQNEDDDQVSSDEDPDGTIDDGWPWDSDDDEED